MLNAMSPEQNEKLARGHLAKVVRRCRHYQQTPSMWWNGLYQNKQGCWTWKNQTCFFLMGKWTFQWKWGAVSGSPTHHWMIKAKYQVCSRNYAGTVKLKRVTNSSITSSPFHSERERETSKDNGQAILRLPYEVHDTRNNEVDRC